jgi:HK97 family phage portal protein
MWPLAPSRMRISRHPQTGYPEYYIDGQGPFGPDTLIHFRGLSFDGLVGFSPIQQARQTLGIHQALEEHQGRFWSNAARPAGALSHPNRLSPEAAERLRAQFNSRHAGVTNAASTVVLEEGMTWTPLAFPDSDLKLITSLQLSDIRIAQLFRVPPRMLMTDVKDTFTYSSAEWEARDFLKWSLRRWIVRLESALLRDNDLFRSNGLGAAYFPRFDTNELLRGDRSGQAQTDIALLQAGVLSVNEVRGNLDLNPMGDPEIELPALTVEPDAPVTYPTVPEPPTLPQTK